MPAELGARAAFRAAVALTMLAAIGAGRAAAQAVTPGRIGGRVVDKETGRALPAARVQVVDQPVVTEADLDGRFRTAPLPPGTYSVRALLIGYASAQVDSVRVTAGQTTVISVALRTAVVQLEAVKVVAEEPTRVASDAGLLAQQQNAAAVTDGISAEAIAKTPDSDAGAAIARVTGVAVLDNKVVVRGLAERYSNTVLNGVEIASPEPDKKFVPLDVFPASLLEALVASKTATPDRSADFAGGSVDVRTKEFPDNTVYSLKVTQGFNSQGTFKSFPAPPRSGSDFFGLDRGKRGVPEPNDNVSAFSQGFRNVWTPASSSARPNSGAELSIGSRRDLGKDALGFVLSGTYTSRREYNPDRFNGLGSGKYTFRDATSGIDWGGIANLSYRLGSGTKLGFKNFYTRTAEDVVTSGSGQRSEPGDAAVRLYQMRYIERYVYQALLTGEHRVGLFFPSRLEWRLSHGRSGRDDVDNRQLTYIDRAGTTTGFLLDDAFPNFRYTYLLSDRIYTGSADWAIPLSLRATSDAELKIGVSHRVQRRLLAGSAYQAYAGNAPIDVRGLPPEEAFAPENLGPTSDGLIEIRKTSAVIFPYVGRDKVDAGYLMVDLPLLPRLRFVGGARWEGWDAAIDVTIDRQAPVPTKRSRDLLFSGNFTYLAGRRTNLRLAVYQTLARPELREFSPGGYPPVVGGLFEYGNPELRRGRIVSGDLRLEFFPRSGELLAVSAFVKRFSEPIVGTVVDQSGTAVSIPDNADRATNQGVELEARTSLGFLSKAVEPLQLGANLTLLRSRVTLASRLGAFDPNLRFQGQSPYLLNLNLGYRVAHPELFLSVLYNRFGERVYRYGVLQDEKQSPNQIEQGRATLDAKARLGLSARWEVTLSAKNLTNPEIVLGEDRGVAAGQAPSITGRTRNGVGLSLSVGYEH